RLAVFPVNIPPLRERGDDLRLLAVSFAAQLGKELRGREVTLGTNAVKALQSHDWPGNVRELENAIERACILSDTIELEPKDLGLPIRNPAEADALQSLDLSGTLSEVAHRAVSFVERKKIEQALKANNGNKGQTAEELGISYKTLLTKIKEYDL
ncbi:MAG TPA: helix-turn-helix domain-containing protein, partial [Pyrinomonadaceae bacterium]